MFDRKAYMHEYNRKRRERFKSARLCFDCEMPLAESDGVRCAKCKSYHAVVARDYARTMMADAKAAGVCYTCRKPLVDARFSRCEDCRKAHITKYYRPHKGGVSV